MQHRQVPLSDVMVGACMQPAQPSTQDQPGLATRSAACVHRQYFHTWQPPVMDALRPHAELMRLMEAAGFEARVALQRKADEEILTILHFKRRLRDGTAEQPDAQRQKAQQLLEEQAQQPAEQQWQQQRQQDAAAGQAGGQQRAAVGRADAMGDQLATPIAAPSLTGQLEHNPIN